MINLLAIALSLFIMPGARILVPCDINEEQTVYQNIIEPEQIDGTEGMNVILEYPYDTMSFDWSTEQIEGFIYYEMPEEYAENGGYFPYQAQQYLYVICKEYDIDYEIVYGLIEKESSYRYNAKSSAGATGLCQIIERYNKDRMERLKVTDLSNPYVNMLVAVDYLSELKQMYIDQGVNEEDLYYYVLAAYNYGPAGAKRHLFNNGRIKYSYNEYIINKANDLKASKK